MVASVWRRCREMAEVGQKPSVANGGFRGLGGSTTCPVGWLRVL